MRDIIIFKNEIFQKKVDTIEILTSSPRRKYNLSKILFDLIPTDNENLIFKDIRGNIETRLNKFNKGDSQGIIVAKVALDRILQHGMPKTKKKIISIIQNNKWILLPISLFPTAPGQGAIGIEVKKDRKNLIKLLDEVNCKKTYENVLQEKKIMARYGGGCQQKIGLSIWERHGKKIISMCGKTDDKITLNQFSILERNKKINKENKKQNIYPIKGIDKNIFDRKLIDNSRKIKGIKDSLIYLSRKNVIEKANNIHPSNIIWTSGVKCWKSMVKKGVWVNGTSESLGESEPLNIDNLLPSDTNYFKLSHSKASSDNFKLIPTYHLHLKRDVIKNIDIKNKDNFFWMSSFQFDEFLKIYPEILKKKHSCGFGNTFNHIEKIIPKTNKISQYLTYNTWLENNRNEKTNE
jgi:hydroxymethylbilane synthase